jgi:hypothetical protein
MARKEWKRALLLPDSVERNIALSNAFRSLGQVVHLLQDTASPAHVRNDGHIKSDPYEVFVEKEIESIAKNTIEFSGSLQNKEGYPPRNLWDSDAYTGNTPLVDTNVGLAEYTNSNFSSYDTIFTETYNNDGNLLNNKKYFPFPRRSDMVVAVELYEDGFDWNKKYRKYFSKITGGEPIPHFAVASRLYGYLDEEPSPVLQGYDEKCHKDYAERLVPRAIGYSAALIDYFFRDEIEITPPASGIYSLANANGQTGFSQVRLRARNVAEGEGEMMAGDLTLVMHYRVALDDPFKGNVVSVDPLSVMTKVTLPGTQVIPRDQPVELIFDLPTAIPHWATDLNLQLVYSGKLGTQGESGFVGEENAVAVGFKDISEPTPFDYINGMDLVCLNGEPLVAGSEAALFAVDANGEPYAMTRDVFADTLRDLYLKFSSTSTTTGASAQSYDLQLDELPPGYHVRLFYLANPLEYSTRMSHQVVLAHDEPWDGREDSLSVYSFNISGLVNQETYVEGKIERVPPKMSKIRGLNVWSSLHWLKRSYPTMDCAAATADIPLVGQEVGSFPLQ